MNTSNSFYELQIIKKAITNLLDRTLPSDAIQALYLIQYQIDDLVWSIATSIYSQSGHQVDFSLVRDLANARLDSLKIIALRQAEEAKQKALEEEAKKIKQARLKAEKEARMKAEEKARMKQEAILNQKEEGVYWQNKKADFANSEAKENLFTSEVFETLKTIIIDQLEVTADRVVLDSNIEENLGADELDAAELVIAIEEEFNIELEDQFCPNSFSMAFNSSYSFKYYCVGDLLDCILSKIE